MSEKLLIARRGSRGSSLDQDRAERLWKASGRVRSRYLEVEVEEVFQTPSDLVDDIRNAHSAVITGEDRSITP